ncbi:MAG: IPT/TIG domain-containing protein [Gammaproteobacteria bacterium]
MSNRINLGIGAILVLAALNQNAAAVGKGRTALPQPAVMSVGVDHEAGLLIIAGQYFGKAAPTIRLGQEPLKVEQFSADRIVARLPPALQTATYRITVTTSDGLTTSGWLTSPLVADTERR